MTPQQLLHQALRLTGGTVINQTKTEIEAHLPKDHPLAQQFGENPTFTTRPAKADRARQIHLLARGSEALTALTQLCTERGSVASLQLPFDRDYAEQLVATFFTEPTPCAADPLLGEEVLRHCSPLCPRREQCHHRLENATVKAIRLGEPQVRPLLQLTYRLELGNSLRNLSELLTITLDPTTGEVVESPILEDEATPQPPPDPTLLETGLAFGRAHVEAQELPQRVALLQAQTSKRLADRWAALEYRWRVGGGAAPPKKRALAARYAINAEVTLLAACWLVAPEVEATVDLGEGQVTVRVRPYLGQVEQPACPGCGQPFASGRLSLDGQYTCNVCHLACTDCGHTVSSEQQEPFGRCKQCAASLCRRCAPRNRPCRACAAGDRWPAFLNQAMAWRSLAAQAKPSKEPLSPAVLDRLPPPLFEEWARLRCEAAGLRVQVLRRRGPYGCDLRVEGRVLALRRWPRPTLIGGQWVEKAATLGERVTVLATSYFSHQAQQRAAALGVELVDRDGLARWEPPAAAPLLVRPSQRAARVMLLADALVEQPAERLGFREPLRVELEGAAAFVAGKEAGRLWSLHQEHSELVRQVLAQGGKCHVRARRTRGGDVWLDARFEWTTAESL